MWERGFFVVAIMACVCVASLALVPIGAGPYTAVHGPITALRAQRAILLLVFSVTSVLLLGPARLFSRENPFVTFISAVGFVPQAVALRPVLCSLRC